MRISIQFSARQGDSATSRGRQAKFVAAKVVGAVAELACQATGEGELEAEFDVVCHADAANILVQVTADPDQNEDALLNWFETVAPSWVSAAWWSVPEGV